ncbi:MAG TPA: hypothetical protein VK735_46275 [Pseudonocardia sp.]|jgi:hypothetical protein|uniref:hypothetical protein n=1 Tax=Pseudonocardia sp. TaxID=60912 RepID=UPI002B58C3CE|nr:hypothetical protein [Pseudonocardia sp.]HTF54897.1 hypothetical protein [Pseudonocardia sp.]
MSELQACRACGRPPDPGGAGVLSWVFDRRPDGANSWLCTDCARTRLRAIETKLPDEWWT